MEHLEQVERVRHARRTQARAEVVHARMFDQRPLALEAGGTLGPVTIAYEHWGVLTNERTNAVLLLHALTGDSHATDDAHGPSRNPGWWRELVGPGRAIDTDRYFVVCPNVLGGCGGSTGPSSAAPDGKPYGSRFPTITIRDQVAAEAALADALGIDRFHAVIGGSMGGMRALEWAVGHPERVARLVVLASGAAATPEQIALCAIQDRIIRLDSAFAGGDYYESDDKADRGLAIARALGQVSYRTELELSERFSASPSLLAGARHPVESYLEHHGQKLVRRFDANSYLVLSRAMNLHDVGRRRGGIKAALARVRARSTIVGITSDRLYPLHLQHTLAEFIPDSVGIERVDSVSGHDGFLTEHEAIAPILRGALRA